MSEPINTAEVQADARNRSWRTLLQGLAIDVSCAVIVVLAAAFSTIEWTPLYWAALGASLGRTVLQTGVAYLMRMWVAPRRSS